MSSMKRLRQSRRWKWRDRVAGAGLLAGLLIGQVGCGPPTANVVVDENGNSIRLSDVGPIASSTTLTTDEKRAELSALGLSDSLIDVVLTVLGGG
jgi:hypothetical protein